MKSKFPNSEILKIRVFEISRQDKINGKAHVIVKSRNSVWSMDISVTFEDFVCYITTRKDIFSYKKPYAEMMVNIINERGSEMELYSEDYMHDYNRDLRHKREAKVKEAKRHLEETEQEYNENIIK
ncbi:MAG: hypothetical protein ACLRFE_03505 [Clostridia bacterium]